MICFITATQSFLSFAVKEYYSEEILNIKPKERKMFFLYKYVYLFIIKLFFKSGLLN